MTPLVTVHGTWGITHHSFWQSTSLFQQAARRAGFVVADEAFWWSGDLCLGSTLQWQVAASSLCWYCRANGLEAPAVLTHSHGWQVLAYAASYGQRFSAALDIEGPVRSDLYPIYAKARENIGRWTHTWNGGDGIIMAGTFGSGLAVDAATALMPEPTENLELPGHYGHSGIFDDLDAWDTLGLWKRLVPA